MRYGVRSVSMDDIARDLGVSKKTLYQHYDSKTSILEAGLQLDRENELKMIGKLIDAGDDAIEAMLMIAQFIGDQLRDINPTAMYDVQKYYRPLWDRELLSRREFIRQSVENNLKRGLSEKLYRNDIDPFILSRLYVGKTFSLIDPELFPPSQFRFYDLYGEFIRHHLFGVVSSKGRKVLRTRLQDDLSAKVKDIVGECQFPDLA